MRLDLTRRVGLAVGALIAMTLPAVADSCQKRQFEGKGYAFEAASAARDAGARLFGLTSLISLIDPENIRSQNLARRLGATIEREIEFMGHPCHIWRHPGKTAA